MLKIWLRQLAVIALVLGGIYCEKASAYDVDFSYERFFRLNTPLNKSEADQWIGSSFRTERPDPALYWDYYLEGDTRLYFGGGTDFNYSAPEFYLQRDDSYLRTSQVEEESGETVQLEEKIGLQFSFGRRLLDWNEHERYWQLGYLNGQQGFSLLSEKQEGLTGIHFTGSTDLIRANIFFSYLFIPTLNPSIDEENGRITSTSEWMRRPPTQTIYNGVPAEIAYQINYPDLNRVLFNKSLGGSLDLKWTEQGFFRIYGIYKPENKIRVNAQAYYDTVSQKVQVEANPVVNHHLLYGVQVHQQLSEHFNFIAGLDVNDPNARLGKDFDVLDPVQMREQNRTFDSEFFKILPSYDRESYAHYSLTYNNRRLILGSHYIHLLSDNERGNDDFFSDTVKWRSALGLYGKYYVTDKWDLLLDWRYDFAREDNILKGETNYFFWPNLHFSLGFELLKAPDRNSYWSAYRANDIVYTGVVYTY